MEAHWEPFGMPIWESSPAISDGKVFIGSMDGNVYAFDAPTGTLLWNYNTNNTRWGLRSSPAVANGIVYIGSSDDILYALKASDGSFVWSFGTDPLANEMYQGAVESSPAVVDGVVYVGAWDGCLYALNASTGKVIWKQYTGAAITFSSPAVAYGMVYVGNAQDTEYLKSSATVCAFNASTGAPIWYYTPTPGIYTMDSSPCVVDGRVYFGSYDDNVYALDALTGEKLWNYTTGGYVSSSPAVAYGKVYVGSDDNKIYCLDETTGALLWDHPTGSWVSSSPAVADGMIFVGSYDNETYALNANTGDVVWSYTTGGPVVSSPAVADGVVYVDGTDNETYAFGQFSLTQTSISVVCQPASVTVDSPATCTATVSGSNPTGTITWSSNSNTGSFSNPSCALSSESCSTTYTDTSPASVEITATYSGDSNNSPSSGSTLLAVTPTIQATTTTVSLSQNPISLNTQVTCTAAVLGSNPTGTITWSSSSSTGSFSQSICTLSSGSCSTTYTDTTNTPQNGVTITATYSGDSNNEQSSDSCLLGYVINPDSSSRWPFTLQPAQPDNGIAQPNLYNLDSSTGTVQQWYDANGLTTSIQLLGIQTGPDYPPDGATNVGPAGYSEVMYGCNLDDASVGNSHSNLLQFPLTVSSLDSLNLWGTPTYSLGTPSPSMPYDFFYDLWLEKTPNSSGPQSGDFEIGITLAYSGDSASKLLGNGPYGSGIPIGTLTNQMYLNGERQSATWNIYYEPFKGTPATFYDFVLATPTPQTSGTVSIRFQDFIDCLSSFPGGSDISTFSLMGIELGTEYAWLETNQATWSWNISSYYLTTDSSNFLTIVTSTEAPSPTSIPQPTVSPQLSPLAQASAYAVATVASSIATVDQTLITGVKTIISGSSLQAGISLGVASVAYGSNQPPGTGSGVNEAVFFDVEVSAGGVALTPGITASVYLTDQSFTASSTISYWDGSTWVSVSTVFVTPDVVSCNLPLSDLTGTPIMVTTPSGGGAGRMPYCD
jgi:outer membrane protein assembly factor BamB